MPKEYDALNIEHFYFFGISSGKNFTDVFQHLSIVGSEYDASSVQHVVGQCRLSAQSVALHATRLIGVIVCLHTDDCDSNYATNATKWISVF